MAENRFINPFATQSSETCSLEYIQKYFVKDVSVYSTITQSRHTIISGSRGTGKSMILRYLEPKCRILENEGQVQSFTQKEPFIGIYVPLKHNALRFSEYADTSNVKLIHIIFEYHLIMYVLSKLADCLMTQFNSNYFDSEKKIAFEKNVLELMKKNDINDHLDINIFSSISDPFERLILFADAECQYIANYLKYKSLGYSNYVYKGIIGGYNDLLLPILKEAKKLFANSDFCFFILLDDASRLFHEQQKVINRWISNRDYTDVCIKVSIIDGDYEFVTSDGLKIEPTHDFKKIPLSDDFYLTRESKKDYEKRIIDVLNKRISESKLATKDITTLLPKDKEQEKILDDIKIKLTGELHNKYTIEHTEKFKESNLSEIELEKKIKKSTRDTVNKIAVPELYRYLFEKDIDRNYAGFENILHLSSGVVRNFLELCATMLDMSSPKNVNYTTNVGEEVIFIDSITQNNAIIKISNQKYNEYIDNVKSSIPIERYAIEKKLRTLLYSLTQLFYTRLTDKDGKERHLFSFSISNEQEVSSDVKEVLDIALHKDIFFHKTIGTKKGGGRERLYILNGILCPLYKLDNTVLRGRVQLTAEEMELACQDSSSFLLKKVAKLKKANNDYNINQISIFDLNEDDDTTIEEDGEECEG